MWELPWWSICNKTVFPTKIQTYLNNLTMANAHTIVILRQNHFSPNRHQVRGIFLMEGKGVYHCLALMPSTEELSKHFRDSTLTLLVALRWEAEAQRWK